MNKTFLSLVIVIIASVYSSSGQKIEKITQTVSMDQLRKAQTIEELLDGFPEELMVTSYRISISGKDIKYSETKAPDHFVSGMFNGVHAGHKLFIEYIMVKKKGSKATPFAFPPRELNVTGDASDHIEEKAKSISISFDSLKSFTYLEDLLEGFPKDSYIYFSFINISGQGFETRHGVWDNTNAKERRELLKSLFDTDSAMLPKPGKRILIDGIRLRKYKDQSDATTYPPILLVIT